VDEADPITAGFVIIGFPAAAMDELATRPLTSRLSFSLNKHCTLSLPLEKIRKIHTKILDCILLIFGFLQVAGKYGNR
jgi:hypothetical protein